MPEITMSDFFSTETAPAPVATKIRYSESYGSYNARRYSRPWIGLITSWPVGGRPEIAWGAYLGDDDGGEVEIMALPGSILRTGQKDSRGNGGSNDWWEAMPNGTMRMIDQSEARKLWGKK